MLDPETTRHDDLRSGAGPWRAGNFRPPGRHLDRDIRCDVAIIGGGITGAFLAEHMTALFPFHFELERMVRTVRWPFFFVLASFSIACLYWIGPSRERARFVWVMPGAGLAALFWGAASFAFSWYVSTLGNYTAAYGSLATVVVFMTWLWLSAMIVLAGAEFNAELEHQTAHDTTTGRPRPLGQRGATMADRVGPPRAE